MFGRRLKLFRLLGFTVHVDLSWIAIALLVTWSLATGVFPNQVPGWTTRTYWLMGVVGMLGLFASIVLHELSHSLVARRFGIPIRGITLFIFGGVAEMHDEPPSPKAEFFTAVAGPIASVGIALSCYGLGLTSEMQGWLSPAPGVFYWLALINAVLVAFNIVPAFPLDGGRVLRAALWHWKNDIRWATRITSNIGSAFGIFLIIAGFVSLIAGNVIGGIWYALIGMFLRSAAQMSYRQLLMRRALEGEPVRRFMNIEPITVPPNTTVSQLVDDYIYEYHFKMFPVVDNGRLLGKVTTREVQEVPKENWEQRRVGEIARFTGDEDTIDINSDAMQALSRMRKTGHSRLLVVENGGLAGIVALKDLLEFLSLKIELQEDRSPPSSSTVPSKPSDRASRRGSTGSMIGSGTRS